MVEGYWLRVEGNAFLCFQLSTLNFQLSTASTRRAQPNRYPDSGFKPHSAFPFRTAEQWLGEFVAVTVAQPSRIFTGFPDI